VKTQGQKFKRRIQQRSDIHHNA